MTRSTNHLERNVIQLYAVSILQNLLNFVIGLRITQHSHLHVLIVSSIHRHVWIRLQHLSQTKDVLASP